MEGREGQPSRPAVEVEILPAWGAVLTLRGEHDLSTESELAAALGQSLRQARVLVDLSECRFMDSTVLKALITAHKQQLEAGGRLELVIPPEARMVERLARLTRLDEVVPVHQSREAGVASLQRDE